MKTLLAATLSLLVLAPATAGAHGLADVRRDIRAWSGAELVFTRAALPPGDYFEIMKPLPSARRLAAARIVLAEVRKYPRGFLAAVGMKRIGVFAGLASKQGDGYRPWLDELGGYRYFGVWNGSNALAAAYYTDEQLPLTLHHEVFHQVDATRAGRTDRALFYGADDTRFALAVAGQKRYATPRVAAKDLAALKAAGEGWVLKGAVSDYAGKHAGEDQAETARYLMSALPDALYQILTRPELPGSQRMLHVLDAYRRATPEGPTFDHFMRVALGRAPAPAARDNPHLSKVDAGIAAGPVRQAIRAVQPAAVRIALGGSGVNLAPSGVVLTAAHVPDRLGRRTTVSFPDGRSFKAVCTAIDARLDLAVLTLEGARDLPVAPVATAAPKAGAWVAIVGQPGDRTPDGEATGYQPFHVSTGHIRGFLADRLGPQSLGATKHDAWTYWGHSGSPLFDRRGRIVAMHNSWDSRTAMRHAVPWEAIVHFLKAARVPHATR